MNNMQQANLYEIKSLIEDMDNKQLKKIILGLSKHILESETGRIRILLELLSAKTRK